MIIVPVLNPDGLTYSIHDDAGWRKNRRPNPGAPGCPGVDDNRNYEVYFGGAGSSAAPCSETHHGPAAFSEADTRNVRWLLEEFPNVLVGVDAHSHGRQILRPGPGGGTFIGSLPVSASDDALYSALETTLRDAIASVNGALYSLGSTSNHAGTSDEYMFFAHRVFGFNTECGTEFQPPWSEAVPVIHEVVTGLRALALSTLDLTWTTPMPLRWVQCLDRTGSMVSLGYDAAARMNAKRFVDLMPLGDAIGIVSFADPAADPVATPVDERSRQELALTVLDDPGDATTARAAIDAIAFGGWTSIGAGLQRSAGMLAGAPAPRAVLLLSDGFENRDPSVASILATWPAGLPVYTIGLGPVADVALLQHIADTTGGLFQASPGALDLHLIYNQMRADMSDADGLVFNRILPAMAKGVDMGLEEHPIDVEPMAERLTVTLSSTLRQAPYLRLVAPSGRGVAASDWGTHVHQGEGYAVYTVERPVPGRWRLVVARTAHAQVMAAFVRSPLRLQIRLPDDVRPGAKLSLTPLVRFDKHLLPAPSLRMRWQPLPSHTVSPKQLQAIESGRKPRVTAAVPAPGSWSREALSRPAAPGRIDIEIQGVVPGGALFHRVMTRTLPALDKTSRPAPPCSTGAPPCHVITAPSPFKAM